MKTHLSTALFLDALQSMGTSPCPRPKGNDYFLIFLCFSLWVSTPASTSQLDWAETDAKPEVGVPVRAPGHSTGRTPLLLGPREREQRQTPSFTVEAEQEDQSTRCRLNTMYL